MTISTLQTIISTLFLILAVAALVMLILLPPLESVQTHPYIDDVESWKEDCGEPGTKQPCAGWDDQDYKDHRTRWERVLMTLRGEDEGMTADEARDVADEKGWPRWIAIAAILDLEAEKRQSKVYRLEYDTLKEILFVASSVATILSAILLMLERIERRRRGP